MSCAESLDAILCVGVTHNICANHRLYLQKKTSKFLWNLFQHNFTGTPLSMSHISVLNLTRVVLLTNLLNRLFPNSNSDFDIKFASFTLKPSPPDFAASTLGKGFPLSTLKKFLIIMQKLRMRCPLFKTEMPFVQRRSTGMLQRFTTHVIQYMTLRWTCWTICSLTNIRIINMQLHF